jgi:hypothetical protein
MAPKVVQQQQDKMSFTCFFEFLSSQFESGYPRRFGKRNV